ncbi:hypothetical protein EJ05DRAFT_275976 [Pseudovirgaria hyperparasitica]|uniref:NFX1-type zinc finger-containing protein 1 n=1 Tax=Pseudovirgaria hyperparasitica TaxID=470096 RepID=A0A6A6WE08_9PEZI|nr:uncharacterized protein EJ05DRAFT_275976 [Pseudovirgaria hyperparasitica]KAF2760220.1 hypothetical protein EJ05DRAFT_275976 [Pseudovirgaria hyperparasitica]
MQRGYEPNVSSGECHEFKRRGTCSKKRCPYRHGAASSNSASSVPNSKAGTNIKECYEFKKSGTCSRNNCRYSHGAVGHRAPLESRSKKAPTKKESSSPIEKKLASWTYQCRSSSGTPSYLRFDELKQFYQEARDLSYADDPDVLQKVIAGLASDGGLLWIKDLGENVPTLTSKTKAADYFTYVLTPFFETITHPNVDAFVMLEPDTQRIYTAVYGPNGRRLQAIFRLVIDIIVSKSNERETTSVGDTRKILRICVEVLSKAADFNQTLAIDDNIKMLVKKLSDYIDLNLQREGAVLSPHIQIFRERLLQRFEIASEIPDLQVSVSIPNQRATFELTRDMPGELSELGPRHDNDFVDISKIEIMPTTQEIMSERQDYLPLLDSSTWHVPGVKGLLDRHFRLLRKDTVGQLSDAIQHLAKARNTKNKSASSRNGLRLHRWRNICVQSINCDMFAGPVLEISFEQAPNIIKMPLKERDKWWASSKRLNADALVCLLDGEGVATFCSVYGPRKTTESNGKKFTSQLPAVSQDRKDKKKAVVNLTLVAEDGESFRSALDSLSKAAPQAIELVEFPGILLASFLPTLKALQVLSQRGEIPFANMLVPNSIPTRGTYNVPPPAYAAEPHFKFDLSCLTKDSTEPLVLSLDQPLSVKDVYSHTQLDKAQATALLNLLTRSIGITQGPPGCGKSFLGVAALRVLLANQHQANLGPIICVCYTNHALDQLLEHLLDHEIKNIIRIGSRSKSTRLAEVNLRVVSKCVEPTKEESKRRFSLYESLETHQEKVNQCLSRLSKLGGTSSIRDYLWHHNRPHHSQLFTHKDEEGWETQGVQSKGPMVFWLGAKDYGGNGNQARSLNDLEKADVWSMSKQERKKLHKHWTERSAAFLRQEIATSIAAHQKAKASHRKIREQLDLRCLQDAKIIGVTTSGMARNLDLFRRLRAKVLCVEEAAEVLEAHVLTAMLPSVEHILLIGDHFQLRPQVQNYELSQESPRGKQYSLDMSLFERLVAPPDGIPATRLPFSTIETQRRMDPSISRLIRNTLYPALKDDDSVKAYEPVAGMRNRLYWFDHRVPEDAVTSEDMNATSKTNAFEVEMVAGLVTHLVKQGAYQADEIAVLTPYLGQLMLLRSRLSQSQAFVVALGDRDQDEIEKAGLSTEEADSSTQIAKTTLLCALRVATVDNFQGEEAKVVVVSLVRSNPERKCGFLKTSNRINVLLSRAQHGMYIIGDSDTSGSIAMWRDVVGMLESENQIGPQLELRCPRHPEDLMAVKTPDDFLKLSPEGGCTLRCIQRLACGHACPSKCHSELMHEVVRCLEPCLRIKAGCTHPCRKPCYQQCDKKCLTKLIGLDIELPCGHHKTELLCWEVQDPKRVLCKTKVRKTVPGCDHVLEVPCHEDVTTLTFKCDHACNKSLECGHNCRRKCSACRIKKEDKPVAINHGLCKQPCGRAFATCEHNCEETCHPGKDCSPCPLPCQVQCSHSQCQRRCCEPCIPCAEEVCASRCPHSSCTAPCAAPCNWLPCSKRCESKLQCGHQCPSVCGEACPKATMCQICAPQAVQDMTVDYIEGLTYRDINLDEEPCVFPACGHIITLTSMDGYMDMGRHYDTSVDGSFTAIKASAAPFSSAELKTCPKCRGSLRALCRYGRIVRRAHLDEASKRFSTLARQTYVSVAEKLNDELEKLPAAKSQLQLQHVTEHCKLKDSMSSQISTIKAGAKDCTRYDALFSCHKNILKYVKQSKENEMPFARMCEVVEARRRLNGSNSEEAFHLDNSVVTSTYRLQGVALQFRCEIAIMSDYLTMITKALGSKASTQIAIDLSQNRAECRRLINDAATAKDPVRQTEGHIFITNLIALERSRCKNEDKYKIFDEKGKRHIAKARDLCKAIPNSVTHFLPSEIDACEKALASGFFNAPLSAKERREVLKAMAGELRGTGHWYSCVNGHPFSIGECGMPMEEARCPTCGARIGGQNHQAVAGVRRADDLEAELRQLHI